MADEPEKKASETDQTRLGLLLEVGLKAKEKLYFDLLKKINEGAKLSPTEQRTFQALGRELQVALDEATGTDVRMGYSDAALYLKISRRSFSYHLQKGQIRQEPDGTFLRSELDRYRDERLEKGDAEDMESLKAKADLVIKQVRAEREQFMLKQLNSQYVPVSEVYKAWASRVKELATALMAWQNRLSPLLENKSRYEISKILAVEVKILLERYSREGQWTSGAEVSNLKDR